MKLNEKIRDIRKNRLKMKLKEFHSKLVDIFGDKALTYYSLCRLEKGHRVDIRIRSLYQICTGLGVSLKELKEGTEEDRSKIVDIIRRADTSENKYVYNEKAIAKIISPKSLKFMAMELTLSPEGATKTEEDPVDVSRFEKLIIMLQGEIVCFIGTEKHTLKKDDTISFASNIPHHFENQSKKVKSRCIIIQNPKSY